MAAISRMTHALGGVLETGSAAARAATDDVSAATLRIDGKGMRGVRFPGMQEYGRVPRPVWAVQQQTPFETRPPWQDTALMGKRGDYLVSDGSHSWPVDRNIFEATYTKGEDGMWIKSGTVHAKPIDAAFEVDTLEGPARGAAGDYLLQGPLGEAWPMPKANFEQQFFLLPS